MNMQHAPGPWFVERCKDNDGSPFLTISGEGISNAWIADVGRGVKLNGKPLGITPQMEADARLLAAAPDMLAALEYCLDSMTREYPHGMPVQLGRHTEEQDWNHATRTARAALAKAKGGAA